MFNKSNEIEDDGFITVYPKLEYPHIVKDGIPKHGSPQDRGSADRYYGRPYDPHWYPEGTGKGSRIEMAQMTSNQIVEYTWGYNNEEDRKDWG